MECLETSWRWADWICNGYIKTIFPDIIIIPMDIIGVIIEFYYEDFRFNSEISANNLMFPNHTTVKKSTERNIYSWGTATFGEPIMKYMWSMLKVSFEWTLKSRFGFGTWFSGLSFRTCPRVFLRDFRLDWKVWSSNGKDTIALAWPAGESMTLMG